MDFNNNFNFDEELFSSLALFYTKGLGYRRCKFLIDHYGSASEAVKNVKNWASHLSIPKDVIDNFLNNSWKEKVNSELKNIKRSKSKVLLLSDPSYPSMLKQIPDPPLLLFYKGNIELLKNPCIAVVGSRVCSKYGRVLAYLISKDLSSYGITVVSGFAVGIDREAHLGAIEETGSSIAVLGCGLDVIYPSKNKDLWDMLKTKGLIITEFPFGTLPESTNFPKRNRIISGLSLGVVVIEAKEKSGSLITAHLGIEQGRTVFAVPSSAYSPYQGTNKLIKQGAVLITSAKDIIEELPFLAKNTLNSLKNQEDSVSDSLNCEEKEVYKLLGQYEKLHIDEISKKLNWSSCKTSEVLLLLELKEIVIQLPGMFYSLKIKTQ